MRLAISLALVFALAALLATPVLAQTPTPFPVTASATVNAIIRVDIIDNGEAGINFGNVNPNTTYNSEAAQNATSGAVRITVGKETNVPLSLRVRGSGPFVNTTNSARQIALDRAAYSISQGGAKLFLTTSPVEFETFDPAGVDKTVNIWHWLTVPADILPGLYTTTFYYSVAQR